MYRFKLCYQGSCHYLAAGSETIAYRQFNQGFKTYQKGYKIELQKDFKPIRWRTV